MVLPVGPPCKTVIWLDKVIMGGLPETISVYSRNDMQRMIRHI